MDLFSLVARLTLDKSQYDQSVSDATEAGQGLASNLSGVFKAAKNSIEAAGVISLVSKGVSMLSRGVTETAEMGDKIDKASQKLGISAEAYQEWDAVLQHSGTSIDSMSVGLKTLASKAASGSDAFEKLGISQKRVASLSREDMFAETITALQNVTDENARAQLAQELFGRSAMEMGALLNTSAEETQAMRDRVHELGGVMSDEAVKSAAAYQDSLQDMNTAINGAKRSLFEALMPAITKLMNAVTNFAPHIKDLMDTFQKFLPIIGAVTAAFVAYKTAVAIGSVIDAVTKATEGMTIAQAALNAVMNANPIMLVVSAIAALITALTLAYATNEDFRNKVDAAWNAVKNTVGVVVEAIGAMFKGLFEWLGNLGKMFTDFISGAWNWGKDLILNFWEGIKAFINKPIDAIRGLAQRITSFLGFSEPEEGPLSNFHTYAPDMMKLFAQGIENNRNLITDAITDAFGVQPQIAVNAQMNQPAQEIVVPKGGATNAANNGPIYMVVDGQVFARLFAPYLDNERGRVGVKLATGGVY